MQLLAVLVTRREQGEVRVEELVGELVAHRDAVEQREDTGAPCFGLAVPHRRLAFVDVDLVERERCEAEVDVAAAPDRRDDGRVAVVREGAAVVEGDGDGTGHGGLPIDEISRVPVNRPGNHLAGDRAHGQPDGGSDDHVGGVVQPDVDARRGDHAREREPDRRKGESARSMAAVNPLTACPLGNELVMGRCMP